MSKITPDHLARHAYVYVRQSSPDQLLHNHESRHRQYGLADRARQLGWSEVVVIDDDLGRSGGGIARPGFERLLGAICEGRVGIVLAIEASRLARNATGSRIVWAPGAVAHGRAIHSQHKTRPPLAHAVVGTDMGNGTPHSRGRHHFFAATSFRMALSSMASASSFFSRAFSSSSAFSRRASETSSPPYLAFHV